ncbi:hypothetical protein [Polyangium sorediatum]|uniref:Methylase-associated X1 domain-containing protein n=1 Tax=Polyangium sorediatum TaxID=889274 RepID=A0ABT6NII8_9BACT|nr:hypothetical protein [Polyangium sorediatum]MDI1428118.1 hypothetical protein [Polyangium sorediatum]
MGIIAYAFLANTRLTKNRPDDEHRFQVKYGSKDGELHPLWQDPFGLYTTLFVGINPERGFFVGADPVLHSPTKFFISVEFKEAHATAIERFGWHAWERERQGADDPVEILAGGQPTAFLRYILFEREALGEDQGHRHLLADRSDRLLVPRNTRGGGQATRSAVPSAERLHTLSHEFAMTESEVLDLIASTPYVKKAVRGSVAEEHLVRVLARLPGATDVHRVPGDGEVDVSIRLDGGRPIGIQCKNVLRQRSRDGLARLDFQRTRAAKADPCSRYYSPHDFDIVAACLHAVTEEWTFKFALPKTLDPHATCVGKLASNVRIDDRWSADVHQVLHLAG